MNTPSISVIIPTLNEGAHIARCMHAILRELPGAQIIIADAQSMDGTRAIAESLGARVIACTHPSRGGQCRLGANHATGDVLMFVHADCVLEPGAGESIEGFVREGGELGRLVLRYDAPAPVYRVLDLLARADHYMSNTGDQTMLISRRLYERIGGIPEQPLFEDIELFRRARRHAPLRILSGRVRVSTRRYDTHGLCWQLCMNTWWMMRYATGRASADRLYQDYMRSKKTLSRSSH